MTFNEWLQVQLNTHGAKPPLKPDGVWGPLSKKALREFQLSHGLPMSGVADDDTVEALREPTAPLLKEPVPTTPIEKMPPWLDEMTRRMGLHEVRDRNRLIEFLKIGKYLGNPAKYPWCGDATESCIVKTLQDERVPSNPFWARAWADFGIPVPHTTVGAIGVIGWKSGGGHVGFIIDWKPGYIKLRGGNQSNQVKDSWFPIKSRSGEFIAFRWPATYPLRHYPRITGVATSGGGVAGTR